MTLLQQFKTSAYILSSLCLAIAVPTTVNGFISQKLTHKILYSSLGATLCYIGYKSDRNRERIESVLHHVQEYSDQQMIFSSFEKPSLPEPSVKIPKISFSNLPMDNYHIYCLNLLMGPSILTKLRSHLEASFQATFTDLQGKNDREILAQTSLIKAISHEKHYVIADKYLPKLMDEPNQKVHYIVVSPSGNPIPNKILDSSAIRLYHPTATEDMAYLNVSNDRIAAISDIG